MQALAMPRGRIIVEQQLLDPSEANEDDVGKVWLTSRRLTCDGLEMSLGKSPRNGASQYSVNRHHSRSGLI